MTIEMGPEEIAIEKQQVEAVFSLGGGELNDGPLCFFNADATPGSDQSMEWRRSWHYDGVPEYAGEDFEDKDDSSKALYLTIVCDCLHGLPPERITLKDDSDKRVYVRVAYFQSSGETECPCSNRVLADEPDPFEGKSCPLCERSSEDTEHGYVYLGDGWCEVVYRHDVVERMREVAQKHNINVWREAVRVISCNCGDYELPAGRVDYRTRELDGETKPKCPSCGDFADDSGATGRNAYWWETCSPGCLPDSDVFGPFYTEKEALEDATEGLDN